jgi:hypothetical protein
VLEKACYDLGPAGWDIYFGHGEPKGGKVVEIAEAYVFHDDFESGDFRYWSSGVGISF